MVTAILVAGAIPRLPEGPQNPARPAHVIAADVAQVHDAVGDALDGGAEAALVLYGTFEPELAATLATVRALSPEARFVAVPVESSPLGVAAVALQVKELAASLPSPGHVLAAVDPALGRLTVQARVGSVAKLRRPAPSVGLHARSWLPGPGFCVRVAPHPAVTVCAPDEMGALDVELTDRHWVLHASAEGSPYAGWPTAAVTASGLPITFLAASSDGVEGYYGTAKATEVVVYRRSIGELSEMAQAATRYRCRWCGAAVAWSSCPFCGAQGVPGAAAPASPTAAAWADR